MSPYAINGKFFCDRLTGMQRYAHEMVRELDGICHVGEFELIVPRDAKSVPDYRNIKVVRFGKRGGIFWEQVLLPLYLRRNKRSCINLLSIVPLLSPKGLVVAHGVNYKVNPQFFKSLRDKVSRLWHIVNYSWYFRRTEMIVTDSEFSRSEIMRTYHVEPERISVVHCSWQHMVSIEGSRDFFDKYLHLPSNEYYFSMSSVNENKNFKWVAQVALLNGERQFAIAGGKDLEGSLDRLGIKKPSNLHFLGYVSDEDAKALMTHCKAFLFPTYYEGFGIPPMEAMSCGAQAIVSNTATMHEVYGDAVHYIDPDNPNVDLEQLLEEPVSSSSEVLNKYSWKESGKKLYDILVNRR